MSEIDRLEEVVSELQQIKGILQSIDSKLDRQ